MVKRLTDEEYYASLPKKQVGTAVLFFDIAGKLLIVKPDYKESWLVPGGSADENESPLQCALRETKEEIGLAAEQLQLVGVYYAPAQKLYSDSLKFIFNGGILTPERIAEIVLESDELEEYAFLALETALPLLSGSLKASIPMCLEAIKNGTISYLEKV